MGSVQTTIVECLPKNSCRAYEYDSSTSQQDYAEDGTSVSTLTCSVKLTLSQPQDDTNYDDTSHSPKAAIDPFSPLTQNYLEENEEVHSIKEDNAKKSICGNNKARDGIVFGDELTYNTITFTNEPNLTSGTLKTLHDGISLHSTIMNCAFLLINEHYNSALREGYLFVYYTFLQQLIAERPFKSLRKHFLALSNKTDIQDLEKAYLLVHHDITGGHWSFIAITFGISTIVSYHDSIDAMRVKFEETQPLIHQFLTALGCNNITFINGRTAQQEDGCSCGIFTIAGIIAHINNTQLTLNKQDVACFRKSIFYSIVQNRLDPSLTAVETRKRPQINLREDNTKRLRINDCAPRQSHLHLNSNIPSSSNEKRSWTQSLITDSFKSEPFTSEDAGEQIKRTKINTTEVSTYRSTSKTTKRKLTKKLKLKEGIYPKTFD
jgi:Ulp1 family protease